ncbi:hypothetical protein YC2023_072742 [Brassica napus]
MGDSQDAKDSERANDISFVQMMNSGEDIIHQQGYENKRIDIIIRFTYTNKDSVLIWRSNLAVGWFAFHLVKHEHVAYIPLYSSVAKLFQFLHDGEYPEAVISEEPKGYSSTNQDNGIGKEEAWKAEKKRSWHRSRDRRLFEEMELENKFSDEIRQPRSPAITEARNGSLMKDIPLYKIIMNKVSNQTMEANLHR